MRGGSLVLACALAAAAPACKKTRPKPLTLSAVCEGEGHDAVSCTVRGTRSARWIAKAGNKELGRGGIGWGSNAGNELGEAEASFAWRDLGGADTVRFILQDGSRAATTDVKLPAHLWYEIEWSPPSEASPAGGVRVRTSPRNSVTIDGKPANSVGGLFAYNVDLLPDFSLVELAVLARDVHVAIVSPDGEAAEEQQRFEVPAAALDALTRGEPLPWAAEHHRGQGIRPALLVWQDGPTKTFAPRGELGHLRDAELIVHSTSEARDAGRCGRYCQFGNDPFTGECYGTTLTVRRTKLRSTVQVRVARTGEVLAEKKFDGSSPHCPTTIETSWGSSEEIIQGDEPRAQVERWLAKSVDTLK